MNRHETEAYQRAFIRYLRKGTPIALSLKAEEHPTTHYIWRTAGDGKVRAAHAANEGEIFAWDNPPPTGHPGEDYNCRCWAEPYNPANQESYYQNVISSVNDASRWGWDEFFDHYFHANGKAVTLEQIGQLQAIIDHAEKNIFPRVRNQVIEKAREVVSGSIQDSFVNSYSFYGVSLAHGDSVVRGEINGVVRKNGEFLIISVTVDYQFSDIFEDVFSVGVEVGTPYDINGYWKTRIEAIVYEDANKSAYK